ncbi:MAG: Cof subfamily protein (haloacid dehalogenase superfamily) [Desulforhopalus sp.]|jgi:Cof subfamily protein (haloacid dehalogenase superfamily)
MNYAGTMINRTKYKGLFVTDLDGTLLTDAKTFNKRDLDALQTLRDQGYAVAIATGRSDYSFHTLMASLGMRGSNFYPAIDYVLFSTGAGIISYPAESLLKSISLSASDVSVIVEYLEVSRLDYMVHMAVPDTHQFFYRQHSEQNSDFSRRLDIYSEYATVLPEGRLPLPQGATEVLCIVPRSKGREITNRIAAEFNQFSVIRATSPLDGESSWIEIFDPRVSKSKGVAWLAEQLGIATENTCAVGNDYNDEDLLHWAEHSYIVRNSPARLQELFQVVASNNEGGVSEVIAHWLG